MKYFLTGLCISLLISCAPAKHIKKVNKQQTESLNSLIAKPKSITYADIDTFVLQKHCIECHNSRQLKRADIALDSFAAIFGEGSRSTVVSFDPENSSLYNTLIAPAGSRRMPPMDQPQLSEKQKQLVYLWIQNGAQKEEGLIVQKPKSLKQQLAPYFKDPKTIDYKVVNEKLFENYCNSCHSSNSSSPDHNAIAYGHDMTNYESVLDNYGIVKGQLLDKWVREKNGRRKRHRGSSLFHSIAIQQSMPPANDGYDPIDAQLVKLLRLWIINCAIENYADIKEKDHLLENVSNDKYRDCKALAEAEQ